MAKSISYSKEMAILKSPRPQTSLSRGNSLSTKRLCQQKRSRLFTPRVSYLVGMFLMEGINQRNRNSGQCDQCVLLWWCCSVTKLCPTLWPHRLQHTRLPCPSLSPRVCSNSCPLIFFNAIQPSHPLLPLSCTQYFPASESFPKSQLFPSDGQNIGSFSSGSVLPVIIQSLLPVGLTGLISLLSKRLPSVFSSTTFQKYQFFELSLFYSSGLTSIYVYWKNHSFDYRWTFVIKVMSLPFNTLSIFVIAFLPRASSGMELTSPVLQADSLPLSHWGSPVCSLLAPNIS